MYFTYLEEDQRIDYDGSQLATRWIERRFGRTGDAAVIFYGSCDVKPEFMIDLEDLEAGARIFSRDMLHLIIETFGEGRTAAVLRQRLTISLIKELIEKLSPDSEVQREGDDLYLAKEGENFKLTVSVATSGPASSLIHTGINLDSEGTPVPAASLAELGIEKGLFARQLLPALAREFDGVEQAAGKVKSPND